MAGNNDANSSGTILLTLLCHKIIIVKTICSYNWTLPWEKKKNITKKLRHFWKAVVTFQKRLFIHSLFYARENKMQCFCSDGLGRVRCFNLSACTSRVGSSTIFDFLGAVFCLTFDNFSFLHWSHMKSIKVTFGWVSGIQP